MIGGLNWMDWSDLAPIPGVNQLVGHTAAETVRHKRTSNTRNICLDTNLNHYAIFEEGTLEIKPWNIAKPA